MKPCAKILFDLRQLTQSGRAPSAERQTAIALLRKKAPPPILAHFDRLVACGRSGVAIVHHGVCGECHMRLPVGTAASLKNPNDVPVCEHCGCYLLLAPEEPVEELRPTVVGSAAPRGGRRSVAVVGV